MRKDDVCRIQQLYIKCCSVFAVPELRKGHVHSHCAANPFRMFRQLTSNVDSAHFKNEPPCIAIPHSFPPLQHVHFSSACESL